MSSYTDLYDKVGGKAGIKTMIHEFYSRIMTDPELSSFFKHTSFDRLRTMQTEFLAVALGGPGEYTGLSLSAAHHGRGITASHLSRFVSHMIETLETRGVAENDVQAIIDRINCRSNEILGISY